MTSPIAQAVEPRRTASVERAAEFAGQTVKRMAEQLEENGWDLDKVAPRPNGRMSRREYRSHEARRAMFNSVVATDGVASDAAAKALGLDPWDAKKPTIVSLREDRAEKFVADARRAADAEFSEYIAKLEGKAGEVTSATIDDAPLWDGSILTVETVEGETVKFKTKQIVNVSSLGKVFNQWPTRRSK